MKRQFLFVLTFVAAPAFAREPQPHPFSEALIFGHTLVAQARGQAQIARFDRDDRTRIAYADTAIKSCANPGSVTQAELDRLPEHPDKDMLSGMPLGLEPCEIIVYLNLGRGVDAEEIRRLSAPKAALEVSPAPRIAPAPLSFDRPTTFMQMLPYVRDFAVASCRNPGQVPFPQNFRRPRGTIQFLPQNDDAAVEYLSSGLGLCELRLFHRLITVIRFGYPQNITDQWMRDVVREYAPR